MIELNFIIQIYMNNKVLVLTFMAFVFILGGLLYLYNPRPTEIIDKEGVACTMEAKLCPDGSYVGRTLPNCEFAPCPISTDTPKEATTTINEQNQ